jgi:4-aminobutyrate aminotransferase-like enzyme
MIESIWFDGEPASNQIRAQIVRDEPRGLRTATPTMAVLARSSGIYHWTPEGRRLADFTSGVLVANLGHNPPDWLRRLLDYLGWDQGATAHTDLTELPPLTAYNATTPLEAQAARRLLDSLRRCPGGGRMEQVLWAASGSEGIQKALWASLHFRPQKDIILATRHGFHGKKGLAGAVTGDENSPDRDPRVRFISFPRRECYDVSQRDDPFDPLPYAAELQQIARDYAGRINCLITEPYLGAAGSLHPPKAYLRLLEHFCREHDVIFVLDEVQSNFGRTGCMYAFETYGVEPDIVVLGKGMGNGIPVNAAVGRADVFGSLSYGEGSDTWSGNLLACAAVLATLDLFESSDILARARQVGAFIEQGLRRLKELDIVAAVRGEAMVWGVEIADFGDQRRNQIALDCVRAAYLGDELGNAIHLLGPLDGNVIRISPPLCITEEEAEHWLAVLFRVFQNVQERLARRAAVAIENAP